MLRIGYEELHRTVGGALRRLGFEEERALLCARLFAETTRDGVYTHGLNRFPRFVRMIRAGRIDIHAAPRTGGGPWRAGAMGRPERSGQPERAPQYGTGAGAGRQHGVGAVALANTTHWMRGGSYGWQAAEAGCIGVCWTNTLPNMPPWGSAEARLGNNPLVVAVPRDGGPVVLDMAMSQFSYGALAAIANVANDCRWTAATIRRGALTRDAGGHRGVAAALPAGYWKGSGLALVLDMIAAMLSGGLATHQIPKDPEREAGISQFFLALDPDGLGAAGAAREMSDRIVASVDCRYPGQRTLEIRAENLALGVPVDPAVWQAVQEMNREGPAAGPAS